MTVRMNVRVKQRGALFSPRSQRIMREATDDIEEQIAEYAYDEVMDRLGAVLHHPTGYYESHVQYHQVGSLWQVDDSNVVYGPWLEDGKNRRKTRFKGYQTFRRVSEKVEREADDIADRILHDRMEEM